MPRREQTHHNCSVCNVQTAVESMTVDRSTGDRYCEQCAQEHLSQCEHCNYHFVRDYMHEHQGDFYCSECYSLHFRTCAQCGAEHHRDVTHTHDGDNYCPRCRYERFRLCNHCDTIYPETEMEHDGMRYLCDACYEENYSRCCECNSFVFNEDVRYYRDRPYCPSHYPRRNIIRNYSHKPVPNFWGEPENPNEFFGIELEIDGGGERDDHAEMVLELINGQYDLGEIAYAKRDGSISSGFEIVSHPCTYEFHMREVGWEAAFKKAVQLGYRSHNAGTCGLHIHISRQAFGNSEYEQDEGIMKLLTLVERFWTEILKFSRRTREQADRWASRYGLHDDPETLLEVAKGSSRYRAVNLNNPFTIEIRIFRGTLKYQTFVASLQFTKLLVELANTLDKREVKEITWDELVLRGSKFEEFIYYLDERGLLSDAVKAELIARNSSSPAENTAQASEFDDRNRPITAETRTIHWMFDREPVAAEI